MAMQFFGRFKDANRVKLLGNTYKINLPPMRVVFVSKSSRFSVENNQSSLLCFSKKTLIMAKPQQQTNEVSRIMKFGVS